MCNVCKEYHVSHDIFTFDEVTSCLEQSLLTSEWVTAEEIDWLQMQGANSELILVARDFVFSCDGYIDQWAIQWYHRGATTLCTETRFTFTVYRLLDACSVLWVLGENTFLDRGSDGQFMESFSM